MDCNIIYAELISDYVSYYNTNGWPTIVDENETISSRVATVGELPHLVPELGSCLLGLYTIKLLRGLDNHPILKQTETNYLYSEVKTKQYNGTYIVPTSEEDKKRKRKLLCKSMSIPYYIWYVKQKEPSYQYDNSQEFDNLKDMFEIYKSIEEPCQFQVHIQGLISHIEQSFKYSQNIKKEALHHK